MLRGLKGMIGFGLAGSDGGLGSVIDFYFDEPGWQVRYVQADTGAWLPGRKVIISPRALGAPDWERRLLPVRLTSAQISGSPQVRLEDPVGREGEGRICRYYGWPDYWCGAGGRLLSLCQAEGYSALAGGAEVGQVEDAIADDSDWALRYFVIDQGGWLLGKKALIPASWTQAVSESDRQLRFDVARESVMDSPKFEGWEKLTREYEKGLHAHYGRRGYWER